MRAPQAIGVGVVRETEQRHIRKVVGDVVRINSRDVGNHEIWRIDSLHRDEPVVGKESLQLAAEEEVDPYKQDRRHACQSR